MQKTYTAMEAAKELGISRGHIYVLLKAGKLQCLTTKSGRARFTEEHLAEFLGIKREKATEKA